MRRRQLLATSAAALAMPRLGGAQSARPLRFVPYIDLSLLDPIATTATPTRNHAMLVFDTLYGLDKDFRPQPQMVAGHTLDAGRLTWTLTLREGLRFHDGEPVLARDCVASIRRWGSRDSSGQTLMAATDELSAPDDRTIRFRLKHRFPQLPFALAKASPSICAIMPERLARTDAAKQVSEMVGSGPFRFVADEYRHGSRVVYARFADYVPREGGGSGNTAGPKVAHFDRVEWHVMPDASTAAAAMQVGEVDWWEAPNPDIVPLLRRSPDIVVQVKDRQGLTPILRFNCIQPPFDNVKLRRACLRATSQADFMQAYSSDPEMWHIKLGMFCPGTPMANDAGMEDLFGPTDLERAKAEVAASGYNGEVVAFMLPLDHPTSAPLGTVGADLFQRIGLNVDIQNMDTGTMFQRRNSREPVDKGGWSVFPSMVSGLNILDPSVASVARGNGPKAWYGWPESPEGERLYAEWMQAEDLDSQKRLAAEIQLQAWQDATFIPNGQILQPMGWRNTITGIPDGFAKFWSVRPA